ncbi:MAG: HNH endonuclease [Prevotella sp.]|nr:HNH endonuclease [Prevotella sp.]
MSRNPKYQKLLNSPRWWQVKRVVWLRDEGRCQQCRKDGIAAGVLPDGYVVPGVDCHHIKPVESAKTYQEMEQLCYNPNNIVLLCVKCHKEAHRQLRSQTRDAHIATEASRAEQWLQRHIAQPTDAEAKPSPPILS